MYHMYDKYLNDTSDKSIVAGLWRACGGLMVWTTDKYHHITI